MSHALTYDPPPAAVTPVPDLAPVPAAATLLDRFADLFYIHRRLLTVVVLALYGLGFNGQWRLEPDAALHLSLGRNLALGHGYTYLGRPHHLVYPGVPWALAGLFRAFGIDRVWPAHVVMLGVTLATLGLVHRLFRLHAGPRAAVVVTFGVAVTKTFYRYAFELRSDMPFLLGLMGVLCGYEAIFARARSAGGPTGGAGRAGAVDWALLVGGLAVATVTRPTIWVLLAAVGLTVAWSAVRGKLRWRTSVVVVAGVIALMLTFRALDPRRTAAGSDEYEVNALSAMTIQARATALHMVTRNLPELLMRAAPDALMQVRLGPFNAVLGLAFIAIGVGLARQRVLWGVLCALIVLMNLILLPLDRYFLPAIPLLAYGWWLALRQAYRVLPPRAADVAVLLLLGLGLASNFDKIGGIIIEQRRTPFVHTYQAGAFEPTVDLCRQLPAVVAPGATVLTRHGTGRIMSYLSGRRVVDDRDFDRVSDTSDRLYAVEPLDDAARSFISAIGLHEGGPVLTAPARSRTETSLTVVRLER